MAAELYMISPCKTSFSYSATSSRFVKFFLTGHPEGSAAMTPGVWRFFTFVLFIFQTYDPQFLQIALKGLSLRKQNVSFFSSKKSDGQESFMCVCVCVYITGDSSLGGTSSDPSWAPPSHCWWLHGLSSIMTHGWKMSRLSNCSSREE